MELPSLWKLLFVNLLFFSGKFVWYMYDFLDMNKTVVAKNDEECIHISGVPGAEDQTLWNENTVLMSSAKRLNLEHEITD